MKGLLNLPWAMTLSAITVQHLALAFPATPPGAGNSAIIAQPGAGNDAIIAETNSTQVTATNAFNGSSPTYSSFPPGISPPDDVTFYTVPDSSPPVTIKFQKITNRMVPGAPWPRQEGRNETAVMALLAELVAEWSAPAKRVVKLTRDSEWDKGPAPEVFITMQPELPSEFEPQDLALLGKSWAAACRGFQDFLTAYPKLGIYYEVYTLYEPRTEFFAASGILSMDRIAMHETVDVTS